MTALAISSRLSSLRRRRPAPAAAPSTVLQVDFEASDGRRWSAVGGGPSVPDALADARAALPAGDWELARFAHVYGD